MAELPSANHITIDPNFIADGVKELPVFLQSKENYAKLVQWYCKRWDTLDKEVIKLAYLRLLDNASGKILDMLGERVGLRRYEQEDISYRALIKLRSFRQTKDDNRPDIVTLLKIIFFGESPIITKSFNNFIEIIIPTNCLSDADIAKQLEDMFPINTNLWVTRTTAVPLYLVNSRTGSIQPDNTSGLSDSKKTSIGGVLTNWIHSSARSIKNT